MRFRGPVARAWVRSTCITGRTIPICCSRCSTSIRSRNLLIQAQFTLDHAQRVVDDSQQFIHLVGIDDQWWGER